MSLLSTDVLDTNTVSRLESREIDEASDPIGADLSEVSIQDARRASSKGFLNLTLEFYLDLLDWTGRNLAAGKRGGIPDHLEPILQRIGIVSSGWCDLIQHALANVRHT